MNVTSGLNRFLDRKHLIVKNTWQIYLSLNYWKEEKERERNQYFFRLTFQLSSVELQFHLLEESEEDIEVKTK